jgi:hypothetical protein
VLLAGADRRTRRRLTGVVIGAAVASTVIGAVMVSLQPPRRTETAVAAYVREHARPDDTQYVLYARANVEFYAGLPSPYPYAWSLMVRARPGAVDGLRRLLASPRRPTWVVDWQPPSRWDLDPSGATARLLAAHYRRVATMGGHPVLHRIA